MEELSYIVISLIAILFFSGMETAYVASNRMRLELARKEKNLNSYLLSFFHRNPQQFISTMFVGKYFSMVVFGFFFTKSLAPEVIDPVGHVFSIIFQIILATVVIIITGEFLPKIIFKLQPILWLKLFSWIIMLFYIVLYPISKIVSWLSVRLLIISKTELSSSSEENVFSMIDLNYLLQENLDTTDGKTEINNDVKIFQNVLDFSNVKLRDCLVPRTEIVAHDYEVPVNTLKQTFIETGLSKILIYKDDIDNITGYIHSSEMFKHQKDWKKRIKPIPIVPENMAAQKLMKIFMQQKKSIAVVVDEFGGTAGIVTLEDIMEEIFGEIEDEHDIREYKAEKTGQNEYLLSGRLEVEEVNSLFNLELPLSEDYTTVAGFILQSHQHFPKLNEVIRIENYTFKFLKVTNNRIELVKMQVNS